MVKMKKLLLILICLFVSYEVRSREIVLVCEVKTMFIFEGKKGDFQLTRESLLGGKDTSKTLLYLDRKKRWLGTDKYNFKKNNIEIYNDSDIELEFYTKDDREYYNWIEYDESPLITTFYKYDSKLKPEFNYCYEDESLKYCDSFTEQIKFDPYDGTVVIEKKYDKYHKMKRERSMEWIFSGENIKQYNVVLEKGVCEKRKKKLF